MKTHQSPVAPRTPAAVRPDRSDDRDARRRTVPAVRTVGPSAEQPVHQLATLSLEDRSEVRNGFGRGMQAALAQAGHRPNRTGLPDRLKAGIESLSGYAMDDVRVHYNSSKPVRVQALAYTQGTDIHIAPGQEQHLPHEAWHVVQQKQGRVKPTLQMKGVAINDDAALEREADAMGARLEIVGHLSVPLQLFEGRAKEAERSYMEAKALQSRISKQHQLSQSPAIADLNVTQRKIIARVRTQKNLTTNVREISEVRLEGRAPTTVQGSGQGHHTVAETLINESVIREIMNFSLKLAMNNMMVLARLTLLPEEGLHELEQIFDRVWSGLDNQEGEDQNSTLEDFVQRYIEIANKRKATAFLVEEELTYGGGKEKQAIGLVRRLADKLEKKEEIKEHDLYDTAGAILGLVDMKYVRDHEQTYVEIIVRALQHAVLSVLPQLPQDKAEALIDYFITGLGQRDGIPMDRMAPISDKVTQRLGLSEKKSES